MRALPALFLATLAAAPPTAAQADRTTKGPGPTADFFEQSQNLIIHNGLPGLRLEQDASAGRPSRTWDVKPQANGTFELTDFKMHNTPLRIFGTATGAPSFSFVLQGRTGNLGLNTSTPAAPLHLKRSDGSAYVLVWDETLSGLPHNVLELVNNGASTVRLDDSAPGGVVWAWGSLGTGNFFMTNMGLAFTLTPTGNATIAGALSQASDRAAKRDFEPVDPQALLGAVAALPVPAWSYTGESVRHVGPMAQDFRAAFGFGGDDRHLAPSDVASVGLVALQALHERAAGLERDVAELEGSLQAREAALHEARLRLDVLRGSVRGVVEDRGGKP